VKAGKDYDWQAKVDASSAYTDSTFATTDALYWSSPYTNNGMGSVRKNSAQFKRARDGLTSTTPVLFNHATSLWIN